MNIDFQAIKNKQRILIVGNQDADKILSMTRLVLDNIGKKYDFVDLHGNKKVTDAPIILIASDVNRLSSAFDYKHHILVVYHVQSDVPSSFKNQDEYFDLFEKLARKTPKAGSILYNKEDNLASVIGALDLEDVRMEDFGPLTARKDTSGFTLPDGSKIATKDDQFLSLAGAVRGLMKRLSVPESILYKSLSAYSEKS